MPLLRQGRKRRWRFGRRTVRYRRLCPGTGKVPRPVVSVQGLSATATVVSSQAMARTSLRRSAEVVPSPAAAATLRHAGRDDGWQPRQTARLRQRELPGRQREIAGGAGVRRPTRSSGRPGRPAGHLQSRRALRPPHAGEPEPRLSVRDANLSDLPMWCAHAYADRRRMNMNWYMNQELAAEHRRELVALWESGSRRPRRHWHLPRVAIPRRRLALPHSTTTRAACE